MKTTKLDERFFESTRGRVVSLLRGQSGTVVELAEALGLTDNAVRAHLLSLERDGLIRRSGVRRGARKPHYAYKLTHEAERLFPKAYDALLNQLIATLKGRLPPSAVEDVLREVGRSLAARHASGAARDTYCPPRLFRRDFISSHTKQATATAVSTITNMISLLIN